MSSFGIAFCISQSAVFSGLNLALLSISKLRLDVAPVESLADGFQQTISQQWFLENWDSSRSGTVAQMFVGMSCNENSRD
jgi:hypothetical protein